MASERRSQFPFIKRGHSVRTAKEKKREDEGTLSRWLRDLRGAASSTHQETDKNETLDRSNPIYHSEGKGLRQKKQSSKDRRRHSFNQRPQASRCCRIRENGDEGSRLEAFAMTGGTGKSSAQYIICTSPLDHRRTGGSKGHEKGASWGGEDSQPIRQHRANSFTQQLKTVMERCEKMSPGDKFLPKVDRDGKILGDSDYSIPSPPERDISQLDPFSKFNETRLSQLSIDGGYDGSQTSLTRAELEQYSRAYEDVRPPSHSQQPSYAQSEGYHSYVSSADSTTTTPFLDRLRRDNIETSGLGSGRGRDSSASSGSSSETLKWHGSISDVSSSGHTLDIAHSSRVPMPQRHHSESILYLEPWNQQNNSQMRRLFPVTTYEPTSPRQLIESYTSSSSRSPPKLSVAERICEIERQNGSRSQHPADLDNKPRSNSRNLPTSTTDHATLKALQKKALLSFYERHHSAWKSEPQLTAPNIPPQPPPRQFQPPPSGGSVPAASSRRSSSASDYAGPSAKREIPKSHLDLSRPHESNGMRDSKHQYSSSCGSLATAALGPVILGPAISVDDWVPARPPKKPHLRAAYPPPPLRPSSPPAAPGRRSSARAACPLPPRSTSPDLPPPSPPPILEGELLYSDEPLPPPPPEVQLHSSLPNKDKARYDRAMNASMSLDNLTRSELRPAFHKAQDTPRVHDIYYENGSELRVNSNENSIKNGLIDKFNERYVENRIESMQTHCDPVPLWDKTCYLDLRRYSSEKKTSLEPQPRSSLLSPPLAPKGKRLSSDQPRSLDSNLSIVESEEVNVPGPQTPVRKSPDKVKHGKMRESFSRAVQNDRLMKIERQSLRCSATKLNLNGKMIVNSVNGRLSPPSRKANLVRTPSDVTSRVSYSHGIHHAKPLGKQHVSLLSKQMCTDIHSDPMKFPVSSHFETDAFSFSPLGKSPSAGGMDQSGVPRSPPALLPHCPPTTLQLSQSKASYLAYRREPKEKEKGLPNFQGSYKRTMSPTGARISSVEKIEDFEVKNVLDEPESNGLLKSEEKTPSHETDDSISSITSSMSPPESIHNNFDNKEVQSKTLPRNQPSSVGQVKRSSRPPRAQSDPTSAKIEKKTVSVSASTQDNLDEERRTDEEKPSILIGRSQSDRTGDARKEDRARGMSDAASQTTPAPSPPPATVPHRRPLLEEVECEQLSRDLASQLSPSHKLHGILVPGPEVKRTTDYVSGLFRMDFAPRTRNSISSLSTSTSTNTEADILCESSPSDSIRLLKSVSVENNGSSMSSLQQKKQELMHRLSKKLSVLRAESVAVNEEIALNDALGVTVTERVEKVARPQEVAKFRLHVKEVGHITSLLLSLSGRLARAENALLTLSPSHQERKSYEDKRDKLLGQLNEAKQLKANIDQRSGCVSTMLYAYLTGDEYTDYDHFINMKSKLLVDSREIAEKIQLGEEQLAALKETLDQVR